jgi:hypothetical protein
LAFLILFHSRCFLFYFSLLLSSLLFSFPCSTLTLYLPFHCPFASCLNIWSKFFSYSFFFSFLFFSFLLNFFFWKCGVSFVYFYIFLYLDVGLNFEETRQITFFLRYVFYFITIVLLSLLFTLYFVSSFKCFFKV